MAQNTLAPWAELVPGAPFPMSVDELWTLPEDDWLYELVEGRLVRMPLPGFGHGCVAGSLQGAVGVWAKQDGPGALLAAGTGFQLGPRTVLAADVAYVQAAHLPPPTSPDYWRYWQLAPDLVAEVSSPSQLRDEMEAKARAWLAGGVRLVWLVWPGSQQVEVWRTDAQGAAVRGALLGPGDALDGLDVLPGFTSPVADLFA